MLHEGIELRSPCPFPTMITISPRAPPTLMNKANYITHTHTHTHTHTYIYIYIYIPGNSGNEGVLHIPQTPRPKPNYQIQFNLIYKTTIWSFTPMQKCSRRILQSQLTGIYIYIYIYIYVCVCVCVCVCEQEASSKHDMIISFQESSLLLDRPKWLPFL